MEAVAVSLRAIGLIALAVLVGGPVFLLICLRAGETCEHGRLRRLVQGFPIAWLVHLVSSVGALGARAMLVAGEISGGVMEPDAIGQYVSGTHAGQIAAIRILLASLIGVPLLFTRRRTADASKVGLTAILCIAGMVALLPAFAGHVAADDGTRGLAPVQMAHLLALSIWMGALPFWIALVLDVQAAVDRERLARLGRVLRGFSRVATLCVIVIGTSGIVLASVYIGTAGDLLGTRYGLLLCTKAALLFGILAIANQLRTGLLPKLGRSDGVPDLAAATRSVRLESTLAVAVVGLGSTMANTTPAIHEQAVWMFPRRLSWAATWPLPETPIVVSISLVVALVALFGWFAIGRRRTVAVRTLLVVVGVGCVGTALWQLSVPAFPDTYRRSTVPYLTVSIAGGMQKFAEHCVSCHGPGALGNGPRALALVKAPADLSAPHTALHTAGDMFWWLTHGIPESGMPGFAAQLDEQSRWDVINFLRAFSEGYQARTLGPDVVPRGPWLGAPSFYFEDDMGQLAELKDYREQSNVLLVFPPRGADGDDRLRLLSAWSAALRLHRTRVLVVSDEPSTTAGLVSVADDAGEIRQTYGLLSRTTNNRGDGSQPGMQRDHMEFLIDRFGYARARWIPGESAPKWQDLDPLLSQAKALNEEPQVRPVPDDHVH